MEHRPLVHLRPSSGWTNDPVGPVRWQGRTHLFHQHNPEGAYWDRPHWGHLVSDDLVRWRRLPNALSPTPGGPDQDGCFSGSAALDGDEVVLAYTGVRGAPGPAQQQVTCLARSRDPLLRTWRKDPANPVTRAPEGEDLLGFRDPFLWWEGGRWWQLVGAGSATTGGSVRCYSSTDLRTWTAHPPLLTAADLRRFDPGWWTGAMWECPVLLRGGRRDVLLLSIHDEVTTHHPLAVVGRRAQGRFTPTAIQRLDLGPDLYAPCLLQQPDGTAISWAWSWEARPEYQQRAAGWAGVLSAPRHLAVVGEQLHVAPHPAITGLRRRAQRVEPRPTATGWQAAGIGGDVLDLELELGGSADRIALLVRRSPEAEEVTTIEFDRVHHELWLDRERASLDPGPRGGRVGGSLPSGTPVRQVRVLLDRSIVEVFVDDRVALTARIYPTRADSTGVAVVGDPPAVADVTLRAWTLDPVWQEMGAPGR